VVLTTRGRGLEAAGPEGRRKKVKKRKDNQHEKKWDGAAHVWGRVEGTKGDPRREEYQKRQKKGGSGMRKKKK